MRKLDLTPYDVTVLTPEGPKPQPYDVSRSLGVVLFNPELRLGALELLESQDLIKKIRAVELNYVLLEEAEFAKVEAAVKAARGYNENDAEFVRRILYAPKIDIVPKG